MLWDIKPLGHYVITVGLEVKVLNSQIKTTFLTGYSNLMCIPLLYICR